MALCKCKKEERVQGQPYGIDCRRAYQRNYQRKTRRIKKVKYQVKDNVSVRTLEEIRHCLGFVEREADKLVSGPPVFAIPPELRRYIHV